MSSRNEDRRRFGVGTLTALVVGNAIGAGVYTTSGFALADLGSREWVLWAWVVGGFVALLGAASYGMLARQVTESGGEYVYLSRSLHPVAGSVAGWISLLAGFSGAIAFSAQALEAYARAAIPALAPLPHHTIAVSSILAAGWMHTRRGHIGARLHNGIVIVMLGGLVTLCIWAAFLWGLGSWTPPPPLHRPPTFRLDVFAMTLVWVSLSYSGFNAAVYVADEARDPHRSIPRAMWLGTAATMILYVAVNTVFLYVPRSDVIAGQPEVAALAAEALGGRMLRRMVEVLIAFSLLTSVTAMVLAGPRVYAKMADDGVLPAIFRSESKPFPRFAIYLQVGLAVLLTLVSGLRELLSYLGLTLSLCLALAVSTLFVRHLRRGERPQTWLYPVAPAMFLACTLTFAGLSAARNPTELVAAAMTFGVGIAAYLLRRSSLLR
ncbi:MAG: APC family permease [Myxococcota bacterium]